MQYFRRSVSGGVSNPCRCLAKVSLSLVLCIQALCVWAQICLPLCEATLVGYTLPPEVRLLRPSEVRPRMCGRKADAVLDSWQAHTVMLPQKLERVQD